MTEQADTAAAPASGADHPASDQPDTRALGRAVIPPSVSGAVTRWRWSEVLGPLLFVVALAYLVASLSAAMTFLVEGTLALLVMVLALQVFIGNSGVLSFGHGAFAIVGGIGTGILTMPMVIKENVLDGLLPFLRNVHTPMWVGIVIAVVLGVVAGLVVGLLLMRLNGLAAGIATFAVLMVADNVFFNSRAVGPGPQVLPQIPRFPFLDISIALCAVALVIAYAVGTSRSGRLLRASREDHLAALALGVSVFRLRVLFFTISGGMAALAGAMYAHHAAAVSARDFYLSYTFMTLAMLIIGGAGSVWGAVVGTVIVGAIGQVLLELETGIQIGNLLFTIPNGVRGAAIAAAFVIMLVWKPRGLTGGREFRLPWVGRSRGARPTS